MKDVKTLADLRESKGLSQSEVANNLGITQQGYGAIERGERGVKVKYVKKLAELYGVETDLIVFLALNNNDKLLNQPTGTEQ